MALHLRGVADGGGWGGAHDGADDARAAADSLLAALDALPAEQPDAVAVAFRLATLLDERLPALDLRIRIGEGFAAVTEALRAVGADALVYPAPGRILALSAVTGRFSSVAGDGLPGRVLVAGDVAIPDGPAVSWVASGTQVVELAARGRLPLTGSAVFVANPRGDRSSATLDAQWLRRAFYPRSTGLGETAENACGAGTPDEVRSHLNASVLHLGCGVTAEGGLELAGSRVLGAADIAARGTAGAGGVAVLPPVSAGAAAALTRALLAAGFVGVIGFREPVPDAVASLVYVLLHTHLVDEGRDPVSAVHAVRTWMADPHRKLPAYLPAWCEATAEDPATADPAYWRALIHHGV